MISAKIILDSISQAGARITTMELVMPRIILAEFNTHRAFSRNSASSRAVSVFKKIEEVLTNPFIPSIFGKNEKGMQATQEIDSGNIERAKEIWIESSKYAAIQARDLAGLGVHKQVVNRLLEPFLWRTVLVTATEWDNFFEQRCSPLAEPHMEMLANKMFQAVKESKPQKLSVNNWHLPFIQIDDVFLFKPNWEEVILVSAARCARVSYQKHGQETKWEDDLKIGKSLLSANPPHWSPFEHQAMAMIGNSDPEYECANFVGWQQARHNSILR